MSRSTLVARGVYTCSFMEQIPLSSNSSPPSLSLFLPPLSFYPFSFPFPFPFPFPFSFPLFHPFPPISPLSPFLLSFPFSTNPGRRSGERCEPKIKFGAFYPFPFLPYLYPFTFPFPFPLSFSPFLSPFPIPFPSPSLMTQTQRYTVVVTCCDLNL